MKNRLNKKRLTLSIYIILVVILIGGLYYYVFINHFFRIPCIFHEITNYYCPGCGITRVVTSLLKLDFYQAFRYNALIVCILPFFIVYGFSVFKNWLYEKDNIKVNNFIWMSLLFVTIIFGILRNIELFDFLIPTVI